MVKRRKSKWRKIDVTEVEQALENKNANRDLEAQALANELFELDTDGAAASSKKPRERRGQVSFAKKPLRELTLKQRRQLAKVETRMANKPETTEKKEAFDPWAEDYRHILRQKPSTVKENAKPNAAPAVKHTHSGQSINPDADKYKELVALQAAREEEKKDSKAALARRWKPMTADLIDKYGEDAVSKMSEAEKLKLYLPEKEETKKFEPAPAKKQSVPKTKKQRTRAAMVKAMEMELQKNREEKALLKSIGTVPEHLKDMKHKKLEIQQRKDYMKAKKAAQKELEKEGVMVKPLRIGRYKFEEEEQMVALPKAGAEGQTEESGMRLATVVAGAAAKERMQSIFRRGMLPAAPYANKDRANKLKDQKFKNKKARKYVNPLFRDKSNLKVSKKTKK